MDSDLRLFQDMRRLIGAHQGDVNLQQIRGVLLWLTDYYNGAEIIDHEGKVVIYGNRHDREDDD